jgi:hypothetical protein
MTHEDSLGAIRQYRHANAANVLHSPFRKGIDPSSFMADQNLVFHILRRYDIPYVLTADRKRGNGDK